MKKLRLTQVGGNEMTRILCPEDQVDLDLEAKRLVIKRSGFQKDRSVYSNVMTVSLER